MAAAAPRLPSAGALRPAEDAARASSRGSSRSTWSSRRRRSTAARRRSTPTGSSSTSAASSAGSRSCATSMRGGAGRPRRGHVRRASTSSSTSAGASSIPRCRPAQPDRRGSAEIIELCERYFRASTRSSRDIVELAGPDADRRPRLRPRLRADARRLLRQHLARAAGLPRLGRRRSSATRTHDTAGRLRRDDPARLRARLGADGRLRRDAEQPGDPHRRSASRQRDAPMSDERTSAARGRDRGRAPASSGIPLTGGRSSSEV